MKEHNSNRIKWLNLRLSQEEYNLIKASFERTTNRKLSQYARKVLLGGPVTINHRDQSLDDIMNSLISLKNELTTIGNNFNQAVKKLHSLSQIAEFKSWLEAYESTKQEMLGKVGEIRDLIAQAARIWLRS